LYKETTGAFDGVQTHDRHENSITFHNQTVSFTKAQLQNFCIMFYHLVGKIAWTDSEITSTYVFTKAQLQNFCIMFYHLVGKIAWTDSEITSTFMFGISSEGMNIV